MSNAPAASVRHRPRQDRSAQRYELILDTTAALIDEVGYPAITMTLVAKRADMSGPGLYRYFDDLNGIAKALALRNVERFVEHANVALADPTLEYQDAMSSMVNIYSEMYRHEPGFRWLRLGDSVSRTLIDGTASNKAILAKYTADMFIKRYEVDYRPDLVATVEIIVEIADALLAKAFETNLEGDEFFINETSFIISEYLEQYLAKPIKAS